MTNYLGLLNLHEWIHSVHFFHSVYFITVDTFVVGCSVTFYLVCLIFKAAIGYCRSVGCLFFCFPLCDHFSSQVIFSDFATIGLPPGLSHLHQHARVLPLV